MALALDEPKDNDDQQDVGGVNYLIDKDLTKRVGDVKVDYMEQGWRSGFVVTSSIPIAAGPSTCGSSCSC